MTSSDHPFVIIFGHTILFSDLSQIFSFSNEAFNFGIALLVIVVGLLLFSTQHTAGPQFSRFADVSSATAAALIGVNIMAALTYFVLPQYCDWVEIDVVITALNAHQDLPLYPDWSKGEGAYSRLYGPLLYEAVGFPLLVSKNIIASKFATTAAFLFAVTTLWYQGRRPSTRAAGLAAKVYLLALVPFGMTSFWVRSEPLLLALVAAGVVTIGIRNDALRWLVLGVLTGFAAALKIHALLYFLPLAIFALIRVPDIRAAGLCATAGATGFIVALVTAFQANPREALNLGRLLIVVSHHKFSAYQLCNNVPIALGLTAPFALTLWGRWAGRGWDSRTALTAASMALSVALVTIVATTPGAGPYHFMPLVPVLLFLTVNLQDRDAIKTADPWPILAVGMIAAAVAPLVLTASWLERAIEGASKTIARYEEAADLAALYPGAQFGPTDGAHIRPLQYRVGAALRGARLTFSVPAWGDLFYFVGLRPEDDPADFSPGPLVWILPRDGAPFSSSPFAAVETKFRSRCQQIDVRQIFAAWRCDNGILMK
jgi:hypothetical protein